MFELPEVLPKIRTSTSNSKNFRGAGVGCGVFAKVSGKVPQIITINVYLIIKAVDNTRDTAVIVISVFALKLDTFSRFPKGPPITGRGQIDFFGSKKHGY